MKRLLGLVAGVLAVLLLVPAQASASALTDCVARQEVCVAGDGRSLISQAQQAKLERLIGGDPIYLVVAPSGPSGYNSSMNEIIAALSGHDRFTVGFLDTRLRHFGAHNSGMLPAHGAAGIATRVVQQHQADQDVLAALTAFVTDVKQHAEPGSGGAAAGPASHALRNLLITLGIIAAIASLGFFVIWRPIRKRREHELGEAKVAAQDDLIALSDRLTDSRADVSVSNQDNRDAAEEQRAALAAYERGTTALDAATRVTDMGAVSRAIAEGQYHLACADACAAGQPRPERRPSCFFDPRHGMSVRDVYWTPSSGGAAAPYRPALPARTRSTGASSPRCATWRSTALRSAMSTPASPRRTGAASDSVPACSPGSCSARHSHPTPSLLPGETSAAGSTAAGTSAVAISGAATSAAEGSVLAALHPSAPAQRRREAPHGRGGQHRAAPPRSDSAWRAELNGGETTPEYRMTRHYLARLSICRAAPRAYRLVMDGLRCRRISWQWQEPLARR